MTKRDRAVIVTWVDSMGAGGWNDSEETRRAGPSTCRTVGWLVKDEPDAMTLALSKCDTESAAPWASLISIPRCSIKRVRRVEVE